MNLSILIKFSVSLSVYLSVCSTLETLFLKLFAKFFFSSFRCSSIDSFAYKYVRKSKIIQTKISDIHYLGMAIKIQYNIITRKQRKVKVDDVSS